MRFTAFALLSLAALLPPPGTAATIVVNDTSPAESLPGACTIRGAVRAAQTAEPVGGCPAGDPVLAGSTNTIVLPRAAVFTFTEGVQFALGQVASAGAFVVEGHGSTLERSDQLPLCDLSPQNSPDEFGFFSFAGFATDARFTLRELTLRNSCGTAVAMTNSLGTLALDRVRFEGGRAVGASAVTYIASGDVEIERSAFLQSVAGTGNVVRVVLQPGRSARISRSTFAGNVTQSQVLFVTGGDAVLRDSTFSGNLTTGTGPASDTVALSSSGHVTVLQNTFADNVRATGRAQLTLAGNADFRVQGNWWTDAIGPNCNFAVGTVTTSGANLSTDKSCGAVSFVPPGGLRALGGYGGPVPTRPPVPGSVAIDVSTSCVDPIDGTPLGTDARGVPRPQDGDSVPGAQCDAGAAEFVRNQAPAILVPPPQATLAAQPVLIAPPIVISDPDARDEAVELRLEPDDGVVDFVPIGLDCTTGNGSADPVAVCRGSIARLNQALAGLSYTPRAGFTGGDSLRIEVNDLGAGGDDGTPRGDAQDLAIQVTAAAAIASIAGPIVFAPTTVGTQSATLPIVIANDGNVQLVVQLPLLPLGSQFSIEGSCPPLAPSATCTLQARFRPTSAGPVSESVNFTSNAANSPTQLQLQGTGLPNTDVIRSDGFESIP